MHALLNHLLYCQLLCCELNSFVTTWSRKIYHVFLGIPKEPFGFSNNKRGNFGPPKWEDVLIKFSESNKKILINLKGI